MSADKKINRDKLPLPEKKDERNRNQEEYDDKSKMVKDRKARKVNYVVKDLPIY